MKKVLNVFCCFIDVLLIVVVLLGLIENLKCESIFLNILYLLFVDWILELFESWIKFMLGLLVKVIVFLFVVGLYLKVWLFDW